MNALAHELETELSKALGVRVGSRAQDVALHGSFGAARRFETERGPMFVKWAERAAFAMFAAEADGLNALAQTNTVRTPRVWSVHRWSQGAFIALEWIDLHPATRSGEAVFGEQLAWLHRTTQALFGWSRDNTIGATPQINTTCADWIEFLCERRLRPQLELALRNGADIDVYESGLRLCESLALFFASYRPAPSLLHGDLWGGNWGVDCDGAPVMFDPAVYFGDREADIAMTRLFGGFGAAFYAAYQSTWALDAGAGVRTALYNLYHVLNHFNLFGGAWLVQARSMIEQLLAEAGS